MEVKKITPRKIKDGQEEAWQLVNGGRDTQCPNTVAENWEEQQPLKTHFQGQAWWCTLLIPALRRQRQVDLCKFEASLIYKASFRTVRAIQRNLSQKIKPNLKQKTKQQKSLLKSYAQGSLFNHEEQSMSVIKNGYNWK